MFFRTLSSGPEFPVPRGGFEKLQRWLRYAVIPEYALVPLFYVFGWYQQFAVAAALQLVFTIGSGTFQYWVFRDGRHGAESCVSWQIQEVQGTHAVIPQGRNERYDKLLEPLKVCGFSLPVPKWLCVFAVQLPNYVHVHQTAVVAGSSWATWSPALAAEFARRWQDVPLFGWFGLPGLLTLCLTQSCALHVLLVHLCGEPDEIADAANLLFLGHALPVSIAKKTAGGAAGKSRFFAAIVAKAPMLWLKVSLLTLTWQCMDGQQRTATLAAVGLAWYAVWPSVQFAAYTLKMNWEEPITWCCLGPLFVVLALIFLHMGGLPLCESHDFSVLHGCTAPGHEQICANSAQ